MIRRCDVRPCSGHITNVRGAAALRVYRASLVGMAIAVPACLVFFLVGLTMVIDEGQVGVSGLIVGAWALLFSIWFGLVLATNRLIVTPAGLVYRNNLRRRFISWSQVRSFEVGRARSLLPWGGLVVRLEVGSVTVACVSGTKRFVARSADELRGLQREHASDPVADGVHPAAGAS
jgi:hypothetical protein